MNTVSAPCKTILFGEHFVMYGTGAILCAINKKIMVKCKQIKENYLVIKSAIGNTKIKLSEKNNIPNVYKPFYVIAKYAQDNYQLKNGLSIIIDSQVPSGVGLGASSACFAATSKAVLDLFDKPSNNEIIKLAIQAEKTIFENVSGADTTTSVLGGIIKYDKKITKIDTSQDIQLVVANSNQIHSTNQAVLGVKKFANTYPDKFQALCKKQLDIIQNAEIEMVNGNISKVGKYMSENQKYLKKIGISNEKLEFMIKLAQEKSYGAKITGAGNGGCIIALVDNSNVDQTMNILLNNGIECFTTKIEKNGINNI